MKVKRNIKEVQDSCQLVQNWTGAPASGSKWLLSVFWHDQNRKLSKLKMIKLENDQNRK